MFFKLFLLLFLFSFVFPSAHSVGRHISCTTHAVYNDSSTEVTLNLVYVKASGVENDIHYFWSTYKLPSVIISKTTTDTEISLDLEKLKKLQKDAIKFSKEPIAVIGLTVNELWEKQYRADTASITDVESETSLGVEFFKYSILNNKTFDCSDIFASANLLSSNPNDERFSLNGTFGIKFSTSGDEVPSVEAPHLIFTGSSSLVKFAFTNLHPNSSRTRYGLELLMFTSMPYDCPDAECKAVTVDSFSDEYSPGVFSDVDIYYPCSKEEKELFLTWRPVSYLSQDVSVASSSDARLTSSCSAYSISNVRSMAELYFSEQDNSTRNAFNITFGTQGDGFYQKAKYTSWNLMAGTGPSIHPQPSVAVLVFASVGLGALSLFILFGGIYMTVQKCKRKNYQSFSDSSVN